MPVAGDTKQPQSNIDLLVNEGKELEERYLRWLDKLSGNCDGPTLVCDARLIALARTNMQLTAMWAIRSIFQPQRIRLPEDNP